MDDSHGGNGIFKYQIGGSDLFRIREKGYRPFRENLAVIALSLHCHRRACSLAPACFLCYDSVSIQKAVEKNMRKTKERQADRLKQESEDRLPERG